MNDFASTAIGQLLLGIIGNLVVAVLLGGSLLRNKRVRRFLRQKILSVLTEGFEQTYASQKEAAEDLLADFNKSKTFGFLGIRGQSLTSDGRELRAVCEDRKIPKRFLLLDPEVVSKGHLSALAGERLGSNKNVYCDEMRTSINRLRVFELQGVHRIELRVYGSEPVFRLFVTDRRVYVSFFDIRKPAADSEMYAIGRNSRLFEWFKAYFERHWEDANQLPRPTPQIDIERRPTPRSS